jgi:hypothetical protein
MSQPCTYNPQRPLCRRRPTPGRRCWECWHRTAEDLVDGRDAVVRVEPEEQVPGGGGPGARRVPQWRRPAPSATWCCTRGSCRGPRRRGRKSKMDCCRRGSAATRSPSSFLGVWSCAVKGVATDPVARAVPHSPRRGGRKGSLRLRCPPSPRATGSPVRRRRRGHPTQPAHRRGDREGSLLLSRPHLVASGSTKPPSCSLCRRRRACAGAAVGAAA